MIFKPSSQSGKVRILEINSCKKFPCKALKSNFSHMDLEVYAYHVILKNLNTKFLIN